MRTLVILLGLTAACGSRSESKLESTPAQAAAPKPAPKPGGVRITYDVDLEKAVDDRASGIKRDLEAGTPGLTVAIATSGTLTAVPRDPSKSAALRASIRASYGALVDLRDCAGAAPGAVCFAITASYAATVKQAALAQVVTTVQRRLVDIGLPDAIAVAKGAQLVVELPGASDEALDETRMVITRSGVLEFVVVDDGAAFMRSVFQRVGDGAGGEATDPDARAAGIRGAVDTWRGPAGDDHTDLYLRGPDRPGLERYVAQLADRDPALALPADRRLGLEHVVEAPGQRPIWRTYLLERTPALTGASVATAEAVTNPDTRESTVMVEFDRTGAQTFADLTARIVGRRLAIVLDGSIKSAPVVMSSIRGGRVQITMGGEATVQAREAKELAPVLRSGALPVPLREASAEMLP
ncbi:MAG: hypothetical protein K8W52_00010 [Deltaproteobacteria bacterium]|nr:hypothetical protein [Deltaproteobacteria bacterium]